MHIFPDSHPYTCAKEKVGVGGRSAKQAMRRRSHATYPELSRGQLITWSKKKGKAASPGLTTASHTLHPDSRQPIRSATAKPHRRQQHPPLALQATALGWGDEHAWAPGLDTLVAVNVEEFVLLDVAGARSASRLHRSE